MSKNYTYRMKLGFIVTAIAISASGCGSSDSASGTEDSSTSGSVAAAIGGSVGGSTSAGTQAFNEKVLGIDQLLHGLNPINSAIASSACPTFSISACGTTQTYASCSFGNSSAVWNGSVGYTCSGNLTTGSVTRSITNSTTRTNAFGSVITISSTGSLPTYTGSSLTGSGTTVNISAGTASSVSVPGIRLIGSVHAVFDHTITANVSRNADGSYSGTATTYHNLIHVTASSTISSLSFSSGCCTPTGGTISTTFSGGGPLKSGYVGVTETLQFTGCGTANYSGPDETGGSVTVSNCI